MMFKHIAVVKPPTDFSGLMALFPPKKNGGSAIGFGSFLPPSVPVVPSPTSVSAELSMSSPDASSSESNMEEDPKSAVSTHSSVQPSDDDSLFRAFLAAPTGDMGIRKRTASQLAGLYPPSAKRNEPQLKAAGFNFSEIVQAEHPAIYPDMPEDLNPFFDFGPASPVRGADLLAMSKLERVQVTDASVEYSFSGNIKVSVDLKKQLANGAHGAVFPAAVRSGEKEWQTVYKRYRPGYENTIFNRISAAFEIIKRLNQGAPHPNMAKPIFMNHFELGKRVDSVAYIEAQTEFSNINDDGIHAVLNINPAGGTALVFKLLVQILELNRFMHTNGFVHGDLKGANLLLDKANKAHLKATDFEFAQHLGKQVFVETTPVYCGEKQLRHLSGNYIVGSDADLNAVGLMLYKWLEGSHLYECVKVMDKRLYTNLTFLAQVIDDPSYTDAKQALSQKAGQDTVLAPLYRIALALIAADGKPEETLSVYRLVMNEMAKHVARYAVTPLQVDQSVTQYMELCKVHA
ncbi:MAG: hypothetical protein AB7F28_08185 [Candidatus Margulisiibacteriota bacterium]